MRSKSANADVAVARVAARQHGVVSRSQLLEAGIGEAGVSRRVQSGRLHRLHRGVYAVGHNGFSLERRWMAAVLAGGEGAVLSHRSAAELWRLLDPAEGPVVISVPTTAGRKHRSGMQIHRRPSLHSRSTTRRRGIPVTTPEQTIHDLKRAVSRQRWRRAVRQAEVFGFRTGLRPYSVPTRSELEDRFLQLCRRHRLPIPEVNVRIGPYEVDFLWRSERVIVETDGYRYHRGSQAFEDDHDRDLALRDLGYDVRCFSYRQVTATPQRVATAVGRALGQR